MLASRPSAVERQIPRSGRALGHSGRDPFAISRKPRQQLRITITEFRGASPMSQGLGLTDNVQYMKGVGPARAEQFARLGVHTVEDLLYLVPRTHVDLREMRSIEQLVEGQEAVVRARLHYFERRVSRQGVSIVEAVFLEGAGQLVATWFHRPDLGSVLKIGDEYQLHGKPKCVDTIWRLSQPKIERAVDAADSRGIVPVYPLTEGLFAQDLRACISHAVAQAADQVVDPLPETFRASKGLPTRSQAIRGLHEPADWPCIESSRKRLAYDELLMLQLAIALKRSAVRRRAGLVIEVSAEVDRRIRRLFPFSLTPAQDMAIREIVGDIGQARPMQRLLQGDVGSGKTAVAIYAILASIAAGHQAVFLAPTELLARQQFQVLDEYLRQSRVRRRLLTGSASVSDRREILDGLVQGKIDLVVGTHALVQPDVQFHRLALVVIDEQHKFGVRQRAGLLGADPPPHQLVMTATPIPRSLAMTWFGDLDLTTIRDRPSGRASVKTHLVPAGDRDKAYDYLAGRARTGALGIVVCPRIHAGDGQRGVQETFHELTNQRFRDLPVGVVHGKMDEMQREQTIRRFRAGDVKVLVATVVVEVGLDIPDATVIVIENAERFGLSQLHQMRGRVGRRSRKGTCLLIQSTDDPGSVERLSVMVASADGFEIAEMDAELRGAGDLLGAKQSGFVRPRFADLKRDAELLQEARRDAVQLIQDDPTLADPSWRSFRKLVSAQYGKAFGLALVG